MKNGDFYAAVSRDCAAYWLSRDTVRAAFYEKQAAIMEGKDLPRPWCPTCGGVRHTASLR